MKAHLFRFLQYFGNPGTFYNVTVNNPGGFCLFRVELYEQLSMFCEEDKAAADSGKQESTPEDTGGIEVKAHRRKARRSYAHEQH